MRGRFVHITVLLLLIVAWSGYEADAGEGWINRMAEVTELFVDDFGSIPNDSGDDTAAVSAALQHAKGVEGPVRIIFSPGLYRLSPQSSAVTSNYVLRMNQLHDVELRGEGTYLMLTEPMSGFMLCTQCANVTVGGMIIDYEVPPFVQGHVTAIDSSLGTFDYVPDPGYSLLDHPQLAQFPRIWGTVRDLAQPHLMKPSAADHIDIDSTEKLSSSLYRITVKPNMKGNIGGAGGIEVGDTVVLVARNHDNHIFRFSESREIALRDLTVYAAPEIVLFAVATDGVEADGLHVIRKPNSDRLISGNADGVHVQSSRDPVLVSNSTFEGLQDDIIAIYSRPMLVGTVMTETELILIPSVGTRIWNVPQVNDELQFVSPASGTIRSTAKVASVSPQTGNSAVTVVLDRPVAGLQTGTGISDADHVYNLNTIGAGFVIENNVLRDSRRYGAYIKSAYGIIEDNEFENLGSSAIMLSDEPNAPNGPAPYHIDVRDNRIDHAAYVQQYNQAASSAGITVLSQKLGRQLAETPNISQIELTGNTITRSQRNGIYLGGVSGAQLSDNVISAAAQDVLEGPLSGVRIDQSEEITIHNLTLTDPRRQLVAGIVIQSSQHLAVDGLQFQLAPGIPNLHEVDLELPPEAVIVNLDSAQYEETAGVWQSSGLKGYNNSPTRFSNSPDAAATWTPEALEGEYKVFVYKIVHPSSEQSTTLSVYHKHGVTQTVLDYSTGMSGWIEIGSFAFDSNTNGYVQLTAPSGQASGYVRTNAAAFVPLEHFAEMTLGEATVVSEPVRIQAVADDTGGSSRLLNAVTARQECWTNPS